MIKILRKLKNNNGSTMVELLCAFTVIMIISAMFLQVVQLSNNMAKKSRQARQQTNELMKEYYLNGEKGIAVNNAVSDELVLTDGRDSFDLKSGIYSYSLTDDKKVLYSFGKHITVEDEQKDEDK